MCMALWECIKCPAKVVCCCFSCALNVLFGILCSVVGLVIIIGLIVYFTVFYNNDSPSSSEQKLQEVITAAPLTFRGYFKQQQ
ncbi:protein midgut expression 1-like [Rhagoletis pomonella]|uniref:protein midgut expression 1-like n=1 Tax=Rhagoletis pomonella TaxID=28610 RepID=UPI0017852762|nr:protein midgut expression 1-like [Rhagoletis pomonella]